MASLLLTPPAIEPVSVAEANGSLGRDDLCAGTMFRSLDVKNLKLGRGFEMRRRWRGTTLTILAVAAVIGLARPDAARAITESTYNYATPQAGYLMVTAAALIPASPNDDYANTGAGLTGTAMERCFQAPVNLPQAAKVTGMRAYYSRPALGDAMKIILRRMKVPNTPIAQDIANVGGFSAPVRASYGPVNYHVATEFQTVQNQTYGYFLLVCLSNAAEFNAARIDYTYQKAGD